MNTSVFEISELHVLGGGTLDDQLDQAIGAGVGAEAFPEIEKQRKEQSGGGSANGQGQRASGRIAHKGQLLR